MKKIRALFLSAQPSVLTALISFFTNDPFILSDFYDYNDLNNLPDKNRKKYELVVINDGCLHKEEIEKANYSLGNEIKKIIYTGEIEKGRLINIIHSGVNGVVSKKTKVEKLREAIITVTNGGKYYCEQIIEIISQVEENEKQGKLEMLTRREQEIFNLVQTGMHNKDIAALLCVSVKTVEVHKQNIKIKLGHNYLEDVLV